MLPTEQILIWKHLFNLLSELSTDSIPDLKVRLSQVIEFFEQEILALTSPGIESGDGAAEPAEADDHLEDPIAGKMQSYLTESHRLLRLLPVDVMLIAAARNPTTTQQRRQAYQDKLNLLLQYCQAIIQNSEL